ncbi:hypothetical protein Clacol_000974 [Clathrus columnatus]|uniref:Uncharacterized protein n=1 Tax=Clathrus columnatus TaxID=1419009 RepID=A0AAV5A2B9_9AGAM|nr:hypothetical protein Clacol_000974 [Clathrus columnatus]
MPPDRGDTKVEMSTRNGMLRSHGGAHNRGPCGVVAGVMLGGFFELNATQFGVNSDADLRMSIEAGTPLQSLSKGSQPRRPSSAYQGDPFLQPQN